MPNRIIKESICTSDTLDKLSWFEEVVFYRLIVNCDDYGRIDGRTSIIKNRLFPLKDNITNKTIADSINKLSTAGLVIPYEYDGKPILQLVTWDRHQSVRNKRSKYPAIDGSEETTATENVHLISLEINCNQMNANVTVIQSNPNPNPNPNPMRDGAPAKHKYGEYGWVKLTEDQYQKLLSDLGQNELDRCIKYVDESAQGNGNKNEWKDWNLTIRKCSRDGWGLKGKQSAKPTKPAHVPSSGPTAGDTERMKKFLDKLRENGGT